MTQRELAGRMGPRYTQAFISMVEAGRRSLRLDGLIRVSRILGVSIDYLVGETRTPDSDRGLPPLVVSANQLRELEAGVDAMRRHIEALMDGPLPAEVTVANGLSAAAEEPDADGEPDSDPEPASSPEELIAPPEMAAEPVPEYRSIRSVEVHASAGPREMVFDEPEGSPVRIDRDLLPRWARNHELSCIGAVGDSMEPEIRAGDVLVVATSCTEAVHDQMVVVHTDDGLVVKRHRKARDGGWEFVSNNPKYPPRRATEEDRLVGRVAWHGPRSAAAPANMEE